jgi:hypothetical protein
MFQRYLKAQFMVLLCGGLVGPIFLAVYFALGPMARPYINWMFWVGLFVTAVDVLAALALTNYGAKSAARHDDLTRQGMLVPARTTGMSDTAWFVNDQQMIKVALHIEVPGQPGFDVQETMAASPVRMQILNARVLVALVEPGTRNYEIDWDASALVAGAVPAQFTVDEDGRTYDLTGQAEPLMEVLRVLHANGIALSGAVDVRANPTVRAQVSEIVRRAAARRGAAPAAPVADWGAVPPAPAAFASTVSQRLEQLETLHATRAITDAEYDAKRQEILADL